MKKLWKEKALGEVCEIKTGKKDVNQGNPNGKYPFFTCAKEHTHSDEFSFNTEALLIAGNGDVGAVSYYKGKFEAYQRTYVLSNFIDISPRFLFFILDGYLKQAVSKQKLGNTMPYIKMGMLADFKIPFPPIFEQKRIVVVLSKAFGALAKAKENAEKNLQSTRELFEAYLQSVFSNPKDNWEMKKWGELCHFVRGPFGGSLKKSIFKKQGYVVYEQQHAIHNHFGNLRYFIDKTKFNEMKRFELRSGDIIMSCSGVTLGRVAIVPDNIRKGIINQALLKLTPVKGVSVHFLKHWLRSKIFQDIITKYSKGAAIPNVPSAKILKDINIPLPSTKEQNEIVNNIELVSNEIKKLENIYQKKIENLDELKKSILQKAFNGELAGARS
ncbi:MAG TPA: restriction endonuclease subunit S [bacterium]|nr:restriction endonuclease subunit S [bacterium]